MEFQIGDEVFVIGPVSEESADEWLMNHSERGTRRGYYEKRKYGSDWAIYLVVDS